LRHVTENPPALGVKFGPLMLGPAPEQPDAAGDTTDPRSAAPVLGVRYEPHW